MYNNLIEFYSIPGHKAADLTLGITYVLCYWLGVPANILALRYITRPSRRRMDLPTHLYSLTSLQDAIISLLSLTHGITMLRGRDVWLPGFCATHFILFQVSQRMSVFLVAALSVTRTYKFWFVR
jgi:hypothetical protein